MKFLIFADFHYNPIDFDPYPEEKLEKLRQIQQRAEKENVSFIIHAGDFCHDAPLRPELMDMYNNFHIPSYNCLGNHDTDRASLEEVLKAYKMESNQYYFDCEDYRFVIFDPNYMKINGEYIHFGEGNYFAEPENRDWMPPENIEWMRKVIEDSPYPCILIGHTSFERPDGIKNHEDVLQMIREVNEKKPHSILMVINGHFHRDYIRILDNVCHFDLNSASFDWIEIPHNHFPKEMYEKVTNLNHTILFNEPLSAVITLEGTTITIDGMESSFFMGIDRTHTENPFYDTASRPCVPKIQSAKFTLH